MTTPIKAHAKLRYLKVSPKKVRPVADVIKGMPVERAIAELKSRGRRASPALIGLLRSAVANAVNVRGLEREELVVKSLLVDPGPSYKRMLPRAMGRATPIMKRTSHITVVLEPVKGSKSLAAKTVQRMVPKQEPSVTATETQSFETESKRDYRKNSSRSSGGGASVKGKKQARGFVPKIFQRKAI